MREVLRPMLGEGMRGYVLTRLSVRVDDAALRHKARAHGGGEGVRLRSSPQVEGAREAGRE